MSDRISLASFFFCSKKGGEKNIGDYEEAKNTVIAADRVTNATLMPRRTPPENADGGLGSDPSTPPGLSSQGTLAGGNFGRGNKGASLLLLLLLLSLLLPLSFLARTGSASMSPPLSASFMSFRTLINVFWTRTSTGSGSGKAEKEEEDDKEKDKSVVVDDGMFVALDAVSSLSLSSGVGVGAVVVIIDNESVAFFKVFWMRT